jgi:integrase
LAVIEEEYQDPLSLFMYALKAPQTKRQWPRRLKVFLDFFKLDCTTIDEKAKQFMIKARLNPGWAQDNLMKFIAFQIERARRNEISETTISNYYKATKLFCEMNYLSLSWKRIRRGIPHGRRAANDRALTMEEIQKLVEYPDRRIKAIIYTMASSGIRIGAWDYLQWKHVTPLSNQNEDIIAAKLLIYPGDHEEYYTFITPEAYNALKEWMDFRAGYGEKITGESWVMCDI